MESSVKRPHVPEEELHAYADGELSPPQRIEIAEHLLGCLICRSQYAEVGELRARASALLAVAAPRTIRVPAAARTVAAAASRRSFPRYWAAAAVAVIGAGIWFSLNPGGAANQASQLATSLTSTPGVFGLSHIESDTAASRARALSLGSRLGTTPYVLMPSLPAPEMRTISPAADIDPIVANEWTPMSWDSARAASGGSLAHVAGLPVESIRVQPAAGGGRPTFMIRQKLPDGRPVWVFEGQVDDITALNQVLLASGISMSTPGRARPDYVQADGQITRTVRMVTVVGHIASDSLDLLMGKLTLR